MFPQPLTTIIKTGSLTGDLVILFILFVIFTLVAAYTGKSRFVTIILSFYPTVFVYKNLPFINSLIFLHGDGMVFVNKVCIFLLILIVFGIIIGRHVFSDTGYTGLSALSRVVGVSISLLVLILVFSFSVIDTSVVHAFSTQINSLFSTPAKIFWWTILPLGFLLF